uniref:Uncharacterized protein n=1 Tax=Arundo donax TaxID=35708 RepID=A0A0A9C4B2_ARUDO
MAKLRRFRVLGDALCALHSAWLR